MAIRYLAFDIETAREFPGDAANWRAYRPLGSCCAATLASDVGQPRLWHGTTPDGRPDRQLSRQDARRLVEYLAKMAAEGYTILTWNGLGFDFDVLAEESGDVTSCQQLASSHVDMMFHVVCSLGYPVALDKAAQGMGLPGKPLGMTGLKAPKFWAEGRFDDVLEYVVQDVRTALQLAQKCEQRRKLEWINSKGRKSSVPLPNGWLTVAQAMGLPQPDVSWMSKPFRRQVLCGWLTSK